MNSNLCSIWYCRYMHTLCAEHVTCARLCLIQCIQDQCTVGLRILNLFDSCSADLGDLAAGFFSFHGLLCLLYSIELPQLFSLRASSLSCVFLLYPVCHAYMFSKLCFLLANLLGSEHIPRGVGVEELDDDFAHWLDDFLPVHYTKECMHARFLPNSISCSRLEAQIIPWTLLAGRNSKYGVGPIRCTEHWHPFILRSGRQVSFLD
jgi:hypothetical protein